MILGANDADPFITNTPGRMYLNQPVPVFAPPQKKTPSQPLVLRSQANDPSMYDVAPIKADSELMTFVKENKLKIAAVGLLLLWRLSK